jgi:S-adenosylmethionine/arginine decarboxylase-like enzyme
VRAEIQNPPKDPVVINSWLAELTDALGMKIMMGPFSAYSEMIGNRGLTGACIIETSHIVAHIWDENSPAMLQLDVYSCAPVDTNLVLERIEQFEPTHVDFKFLDRADKFLRMF